MEPKYVRAKVSGEAPIRDVLTRESVEPGGVVTLLVREPGQSPPRCPRHPRRGQGDASAACLCSGTVLQGLIEQGAITDVQDYDPTAPKLKPKA